MPGTTEPPIILVTGASGLIGTRLVAAFEADGHRVLRAVRRDARHEQEVGWHPAPGRSTATKWKVSTGSSTSRETSIAGKRWSKTYKQTLIDSRVDGTTLIADSIAASIANRVCSRLRPSATMAIKAHAAR